jgi:hypothetical protein
VEEETSQRGLPTTTGFAAREAIAMLRKRNIAPAPLLLRAGLSEDGLARAVDESNGLPKRVSAVGQCRFLEYSAEAMDDSAFGLHLAKTSSVRASRCHPKRWRAWSRSSSTARRDGMTKPKPSPTSSSRRPPDARAAHRLPARQAGCRRLQLANSTGPRNFSGRILVKVRGDAGVSQRRKSPPMQALLDLAQTGTIVVIGGGLIYALLLIRRTLAEFNAAAARCRVDLEGPSRSAAAEEAAQKTRREYRDDRPSLASQDPQRPEAGDDDEAAGEPRT